MSTYSDEPQRADISIVGEINPDFIVRGVPQELPEEREVLASGFTLTLGSSSAILAHNLSLLGSRVLFCSRVGKDMLGEVCLEMLSKAGVDLSHVVQSATGANTGVTLIFPLAETRRIITYPGTMFEMCFEDLDLDYLAQARHFHLSSYFLHHKLIPDIPRLFEEMKRRGLTVSLDTNDDPDGTWGAGLQDAISLVDVLFATEGEAKKIAGSEDYVSTLRAKVPLLVIKRGVHGASAYTGDRRYDAAALRVEVSDSVGAGDTFDAGFLHRWVCEEPIETCLAFGNVVGGLSVTRPGGIEAFSDADYRESFLARHWKQNVLVP
jgi:sugar/nucleoside kinase (ribokinase family)